MAARTRHGAACVLGVLCCDRHSCGDDGSLYSCYAAFCCVCKLLQVLLGLHKLNGSRLANSEMLFARLWKVASGDCAGDACTADLCCGFHGIVRQSRLWLLTHVHGIIGT